MSENEKYIIKATKDDIIIDNADLMDMAAVATNLLHRVAQEMGAKMIAHSENGDFTVKIITSKTKEEQK